MPPYQLLKTSEKNKDLLLTEGYLYRLKRTSLSGRKYWVCRYCTRCYDGSKKCSRVITLPNDPNAIIRQLHNHAAITVDGQMKAWRSSRQNPSSPALTNPAKSESTEATTWKITAEKKQRLANVIETLYKQSQKTTASTTAMENKNSDGAEECPLNLTLRQIPPPPPPPPAPTQNGSRQNYGMMNYPNGYGHHAFMNYPNGYGHHALMNYPNGYGHHALMNYPNGYGNYAFMNYQQQRGYQQFHPQMPQMPQIPQNRSRPPLFLHQQILPTPIASGMSFNASSYLQKGKHCVFH